MRRILSLLLPLLATAANAATFVVAPDDVTVRAAGAIVSGTALESHSRRSASGGIETVTTIVVDEAIKGTPRTGEQLEVITLGGFVDGVGLVVPGSPQFANGERVVLLLTRNQQGTWTPKHQALGVFRFDRGLLLRDEIHGFTTDGRAHQEPIRDAQRFLAFIRATVRSETAVADYATTASASRFTPRSEAATVASYLLVGNSSSGRLGVRWSTFPAPQSFLSNGAQLGAVGGGVPAAQKGLAAWTNESSSNAVLAYAGTTSRLNGLRSQDGMNSILFNDPGNEIDGTFDPVEGGTLAIGGTWYGAATHTFGGEMFYTVTEADLVVQDGLPSPWVAGGGFDTVVTHELGHCLGLRHSDQPPAGGTRSTTAIMNSTVQLSGSGFGAVLQAWDREAMAAVYGSGPVCVAPSITRQPQSINLAQPESVGLSVTATGDAPLTYRWYEGARGDTRVLVGSSAAITVAPRATTRYWVRVANDCDSPADSETATVTIAGCPAVQIDAQPESTTIFDGETRTLAIAATGGTVSVQWFAGARGDTTFPIGSGNTIAVSPRVTTRYWARASNACGATADSETITITVLPCFAPRIIAQPSSGIVVIGESASLAATAVGTEPLTLAWFEGQPGDTSRPIGNGTTIATPPLTAPATFWLRASNPCGSVDSEAAAIAVTTSCSAPAIVNGPIATPVVTGGSALITIEATGTSLVYRWYEGPVLDFTHPVGGSSPFLFAGAITEPTQFWVRIENSCGSVQSAAVTVTPTATRRRSTGKSIPIN